ncbi:Proteoglycan 4 [Dissostichus eleginoides]|uniref:Proteoglycan 4 n=1 Tax=Dissostichus eleginoides TaxID=100907 RepID=A0AAD9ESI4_DISEL|nr:Proteoglycan 4 [Dissostichus eleginoides]
MLTRKADFIKHLALCKAKHSAITPIIPDPSTPIIPDPATPIIPDPSTPIIPDPATPIIPDPSTPIIPDPSTPIIPDPSTPIIPDPSTPIIPDPSTPIIPDPATPIIPDPATPSSQIHHPIIPDPAIPIIPDQAIPIIPDPATPIIPDPATPIIPDPSTPIIPDPAIPIIPDPSTPIIPGGKMQRVRVEPVLKKKCTICHVLINVKRHMERKHSAKQKDITASSHLQSECIDPEHGVYAVHKAFHGTSIPLHVQNKVWGENQHVSCENNECQVNLELAWRSGIKAYQCTHLKSITYCSSYASPTELDEETLTEMVNNKWFGEDKKRLPGSAKPCQT